MALNPILARGYNNLLPHPTLPYPVPLKPLALIAPIFSLLTVIPCLQSGVDSGAVDYTVALGAQKLSDCRTSVYYQCASMHIAQSLQRLLRLYSYTSGELVV